MKKLLSGILDFRANVRPKVKEIFSQLALGQSPDSLFIACSDSRVVPNLFASTDPGDLFVVRNVGNLVPPCGGDHGMSTADDSESAAIEFAVHSLGVRDVIVCGHSECGAMQAILAGRDNLKAPNLKAWLRHGEPALEGVVKNLSATKDLSPHNRLSQHNVLNQVEHLKTYPIVREKIDAGQLRIHAWWFELADASVHHFDSDSGLFVEIDEIVARKILSEI